MNTPRPPPVVVVPFMCSHLMLTPPQNVTPPRQPLVLDLDELLIEAAIKEITPHAQSVAVKEVPLAALRGDSRRGKPPFVGFIPEDVPASADGTVKFVVAHLSAETLLKTFPDSERPTKPRASLFRMIRLLDHTLPKVYRTSLDRHHDGNGTSLYLPGAEAMRALLALRFGEDAIQLYPSHGIATRTEIRREVAENRWPLAIVIPGQPSLENPDGVVTGRYGTSFHDFYHAWRLSCHPVATRKAALELAGRMDTFAASLGGQEQDALHTEIKKAQKCWGSQVPTQFSFWTINVLTSLFLQPSRSTFLSNITKLIADAAHTVIELEVTPDLPSPADAKFNAELLFNGFRIAHPYMNFKEPHHDEFLRFLAYTITANHLVAPIFRPNGNVFQENKITPQILA